MKLTLKHALAAIILVLSFSTPVTAGPVEDAAAALGRGDYATALRLIRPLADQGDAYAQYNLGLRYANGQGVPQNYEEARKWYRLAADQGNTRSQFRLGVLYADGHGVPQNDAEALKWYRRAADRGNALAQYNLGVRYANGQGVTQDYGRAHLWFNLSAARGNQEAVRYRDEVEQNMTPAQIAEAQKLVREWRLKPQP